MKIAGINFDHFHMGDLLRYAFDHPTAEIVGISDEQPERMQSAATLFRIPQNDFREVQPSLARTPCNLSLQYCASTRNRSTLDQRGRVDERQRRS